jgi:hypothetical protein
MIRALILIVLIAGLGGVAIGAAMPGPEGPPQLLPAASAVGIRFDTLLLGGYAGGSFDDAVPVLASDLSIEERALIAQHLTHIFPDVVVAGGLGSAGRLRVAYERAVRPDGSTRSIRVLTAEVAASGRIHTAYYFEREGQPGYFDSFGHSLDSSGWQGPLASIRVTSSYGSARMHPILEQVLPHTGVDLAAPIGEPVHATADGVVTSAGQNGGYGLAIEVQHANGFSTRYAHLSALSAGIGPARVVRQGDVIGFTGMSGMATGPHLHYEVRRRGQAMDPMQLSSDGFFAAEVAFDPRWTSERRHLGALLTRAPTAVSSRGSRVATRF